MLIPLRKCLAELIDHSDDLSSPGNYNLQMEIYNKEIQTTAKQAFLYDISNKIRNLALSEYNLCEKKSMIMSVRMILKLCLGLNHTAADRLLLLLEQILEDELAPSAAARLHQRATLVELSQLDGCEPELFGQGRHGSDRVLVVAR